MRMFVRQAGLRRLFFSVIVIVFDLRRRGMLPVLFALLAFSPPAVLVSCWSSREPLSLRCMFRSAVRFFPAQPFLDSLAPHPFFEQLIVEPLESVTRDCPHREPLGLLPLISRDVIFCPR